MARGTSPAERIRFLDNLRTFCVLAVVALHACMAYASLVPWWYVTDRARSDVLNLVLLVADGFTMPTLFFIAGYFALASLRRHGCRGFLAGKLRRLGIPLVALTFLYCPVISYVAYLGQGGTRGYLGYWAGLLPLAADWRFRLFAPFERLPVWRGLLCPYHLWFLALLLVFCLLLAAAGAVLGRRVTEDGEAVPGRPGFGVFLALALAVGLVEAFAQTRTPDISWASLGPLLVFQPARLPLYVGIFGLGAYARQRRWFTVFGIPGPAWCWGLLSAVGFAAMIASGMANLAPGEKFLLVPAAHGLARTFFALAFLGLLAVVARRRWNGSGAISASLAAASYDIYLIHLPLVVVLQYLLAGATLPGLAKFGLVLAGSVPACLGASALLERRRMVWAPAGVLAVFGTCLLAWG